MRKLYKLHTEQKIKVSKKIKNFLDPHFICIPFDDTSFWEDKEILKNRVILETDEIDYTASISGTVKQMIEISINNKKQNGILINNDYKENDVKYKIKKPKTVEEFLKLIKKDFLYKKLIHKNAKNIVINGIEDEPFCYTESFLLKENSDLIFETIELLNSIYEVKNNYIVLKNSEQENIDKYLNTIGSFPGISVLILDNLYLLGHDKFLLEKLKLEETETIILKPSEILELRNYIKFGYPKTEKYLTIINLNENKAEVINLKKYTVVAELINKFIKNESDNLYIKNGLMKGIKINPGKEIINNDFNSLIVTKKVKTAEKECINCGKCHIVCPLKKVPNIAYLNNTKINCLDCGLCSYMCPSKINLRKVTTGDGYE